MKHDGVARRATPALSIDGVARCATPALRIDGMALGATLALCIVLPACGSDDDTSRSQAKAPQPIVNLVADNNRNGKLDFDDPSEEASEETWSRASGAVFLVNLDDDDEDGIADNQDQIVNGPADELDLARVAVQPWPDAPDTASGKLVLALPAPDFVRTFRRGASNWTEVDLGGPAGLALSAEDLRSGLEIGIEATDFVRTQAQAWQGLATLTLSVEGEKGPLGEDTVELRAAPWLMNHNLRPFDTVYFSDFSPVFADSMSIAVEDAGLAVRLVHDSYAGDGWEDIWFEDWFQTGWTAMPGPDGGVQGMIVLNPRPWGRDEYGSKYGSDYLPVTYLRKHMLGPDRGVAVFFDEKTELGSGSTFDSHGNHEALPPHGEAPAGRLLLGSGILQTTRDFYAAQQVQPPVYLNTAWLYVGHMDEVYSAVRASTPRGFKMIQNTPALCKTLFEKWRAEGHGDAPIFQGKYDPWDSKPWESNVAQVLDDAVMMSWNQEAQAAIDLMHDELATEAGLAEDEFLPVPVLYEEIDGGKIAWLPDTANIRVIGSGDVTVFAKTFGPMVSGEDLFAQDLLARLTDPAKKLGSDGQGLQVRFADSWSYHLLDGDAHCASNWTALPTAAEPKWWDAAD